MQVPSLEDAPTSSALISNTKRISTYESQKAKQLYRRRIICRIGWVVLTISVLYLFKIAVYWVLEKPGPFIDYKDYNSYGDHKNS